MGNDIYNVFEKSVKDYFSNLKIVIPSAVLWGLIFLVSIAGASIAYKLQTTLGNIAWTVGAWVLTIGMMGYFFSGMIGMALDNVNEKRKGFYYYAKKYWFRNFLILAAVMLVGILIGRVAHYVAFYLGQIFSLDVGPAQFVFLLIYFLELIGVLVFFTFSSVFLVIDDKNVLESIMRSKNFVKKNYLSTLTLSVIIFMILFIIGFVPGGYAELLEYIIVVPLSAIILLRFVLQRRR